MNKRKTRATEAVSSEITAYKGFQADMSCRGYQYAVGQTYEHDGSVVRCAAGGFHSCEMPLDTWNYYSPATSKFAEVKAAGQIDRAEDEDTKIASGKITIQAELHIGELVKRAAAWIIDRAKCNTATGDWGHAAATGKQSVAAALGIHGTAMAGPGGWIVLSAWKRDENHDWVIACVRAAKVGSVEGIRANTAYRLTVDGEFEVVT